MDQGDDVRAQLATFAAEASAGSPFTCAPADDGTLDAAKLDTDFRADDAAADRLATWLYDYASYALFLSQPHLRRRDEGQAPSGRVASRVAGMLEAIAPKEPLGLAAPAPAHLTVPSPPSDRTSSSEQVHAAQSISTLRMRRYMPGLMPGLDPSRTVRMASFKDDASPSPSAVNAPATTPVSAPSASAPVADAAYDVQPAQTARVPTRPARATRLVPPIAVGAVLLAAGLSWLVYPGGPGAAAPVTSTKTETSSTAIAPTSAVAPSPRETASGDPGAPRTEVVIACEPQCGGIYVDGKQLPPSSDAMFVTAGHHDIAVRRPGYATDYRRVLVAEGESRAVTFQLVASTGKRAGGH
jgi:hypothetical protein